MREVTIQGNTINGKFTDGRTFSTYAPNDPNLVERLIDKGVLIHAAPAEESVPSLFGMLISWFPMLLLIGVWIFFMRQMQGGGGRAMGFGKSRARLLTEKVGRITFDDVAGIDEAKQELEEIVEYLKDPQKFQRLGGKIPKGVLLVGPPGTGKTLLARAIAGEANVPFFTISGSDFVEMFVGVGASRVRDMFEQGKKNAPCIIFIDEIDAVGRHRGAGLGGGNDEREQTLNQLLVEMDGFEANEGVILIAATNRPDVLDPALLRPGRFDRQVVVPNPDVVGREKILKVHMRKVPLASDVDPRIIARGTPGFSGADLANLVNEAALMAARKGKRSVTMSEFEMAKDKVHDGRRAALDGDDRGREEAHRLSRRRPRARHALCRRATSRCTRSPSSRAAARWASPCSCPSATSYSQSKMELEAMLASLFGGRVAEELIFGTESVTTGAADDIRRATSWRAAWSPSSASASKLGPLRYSRERGGSVPRPLGDAAQERLRRDRQDDRRGDPPHRRGRRATRARDPDRASGRAACARQGPLGIRDAVGRRDPRVIRGEKIVRDTGGPVEDPVRNAPPRGRSSVPPAGRDKPAGGLEPEPQPGG